LGEFHLGSAYTKNAFAYVLYGYARRTRSFFGCGSRGHEPWIRKPSSSKDLLEVFFELENVGLLLPRQQAAVTTTVRLSQHTHAAAPFDAGPTTFPSLVVHEISLPASPAWV
jgi:hypothetical protein